MSLSDAGAPVVAVGSDGSAGIIAFAAGDGQRSKEVRTQLDGATAIAEALGEILVTGYRAPGGIVENATGTLLRSATQGTQIRLRAFKGTKQLLDVVFRSAKTGYIIAATGRGDVAWKSRTGGRTWTKLRGGPRGLSLERLVEGGSFYAVGGSGLVRVP